ncbi:MAG TPA: hypothetical protein VFA84_11815 [Acidimicrobiales bacterium]|nr:hypothetical protein [Acidimicrobiales bacterium]
MTTTMFSDLTARVAATLGMPDCRRVVVGHPLGGTPAATLLAWADDSVERMIAEFTT